MRIWCIKIGNVFALHYLHLYICYRRCDIGHCFLLRLFYLSWRIQHSFEIVLFYSDEFSSLLRLFSLSWRIQQSFEIVFLYPDEFSSLLRLFSFILTNSAVFWDCFHLFWRIQQSFEIFFIYSDEFSSLLRLFSLILTNSAVFWDCFHLFWRIQQSFEFVFIYSDEFSRLLRLFSFILTNSAVFWVEMDCYHPVYKHEWFIGICIKWTRGPWATSLTWVTLAHMKTFFKFERTFHFLWPIWPSGPMILTNLLMHYCQKAFMHK
jgi:hypothetical protein